MKHRCQHWVFSLALVTCMAAALGQQPADTILFNGKILTVNKNFDIAQAVALRGKQIAAVGTDAEILLKQGELIESAAVFSDRSRCVRPTDRIHVLGVLTNRKHPVSPSQPVACAVRPGHRMLNGLTAPLLI